MNTNAVKNYLIKNIREVQEFNNNLSPAKYAIANTGTGVMMVLVHDLLLRNGSSHRRAWTYGILAGHLFAQVVTYKEQIAKAKKQIAEFKAEKARHQARMSIFRDDDPYTDEEAHYDEEEVTMEKVFPFTEPIVIEMEPGATEEEMQAKVEEALDKVKSSIEQVISKNVDTERNDDFTKRIGFNL